MKPDEMMKTLYQMLEDLGFDYDRMSDSGQETYDDIMELAKMLVKLYE